VLRAIMRVSDSVSEGSISTPELSIPCGSMIVLAALSAAAYNSGRWRSYQRRWSRPTGATAGDHSIKSGRLGGFPLRAQFAKKYDAGPYRPMGLELAF